MRIAYPALLLALACSPPILRGQGAAATNQPPPSATASAAMAPPSSLLQPSLTVVQNTLDALKLDKWKKGSVRDEAGDNVEAIVHDLQTNLPPLMTAADAAPAEISKAMPLVKHLDAVYDVLLRVEEGARVSAPTDQIGSLQEALKVFESARVNLDDQLQQNAALQEKQLADLQSALKAQQDAARAAPPPPAAPVPCKPVTHTRKKRTSTPPKGTQNPPPATQKQQ